MNELVAERAWLAASAHGDFGGTRVFCTKEQFLSTVWWRDAWVNVVRTADATQGMSPRHRGWAAFNSYRRSTHVPQYSLEEFNAVNPVLVNAWIQVAGFISPRHDKHTRKTEKRLRQIGNLAKALDDAHNEVHGYPLSHEAPGKSIRKIAKALIRRGVIVKEKGDSKMTAYMDKGLDDIKRQTRVAALTEAHRIAQDIMRLSADAGSTGAMIGAKAVRDRIQSLIEEASI